MSDKPVLLFLHGVGKGDREGKWKTALEQALRDLDYPELTHVEVIAPKYAHALRDWDDEQEIPETTVARLSGEAAKRNRREYESRAGAVEHRLGRYDRGVGIVGGDALVAAAIALPNFQQARKFLRDDHVRAQVLNRIISFLPEKGEIVILAHSLGSVIAADLLARLPTGITVSSMITIGSPLAHGAFGLEKLRETLEDPPTNLGWWVNFWNSPDFVAAHRGVSSAFPWVVDFRIATKSVFPQAHYAAEYLSNEAVAAAVGFALFGSKATDVAKVERSVDIPLSPAEDLALVALRYAHLIKERLTKDAQDRFAGALRYVQASTIEDMINARNAARSGVPSVIASLAFDPTDPEAKAPAPPPARYLERDEAAVMMTILASGNVIQPFEIAVPKGTQQLAMEDLTSELGLSSKYGTDVFAAGKIARDALKAGGLNWLRWGAIGAGAIAIVAATGGLALAAGAGLAGAAVITSALATFGPGGMIGGLLTAGTLVGVGGGGIAFGLASPTTTPETVEAVVERQLTIAVLRELQRLDADPGIWRALTETEIEVRRQYERIDEFSDDSAPALKDLARKLAAIERALKYLKDKGLAPDPFAADLDGDIDPFLANQDGSD